MSVSGDDSAEGAGATALPDEAWVTALAALDVMGPATLHALVVRHGPRGAWSAVRSGRVRRGDPAGSANAEVPAPGGRRSGPSWQARAARIDPVALWRHTSRRGSGWCAAPAPASRLRWSTTRPPAILFVAGDPDALVGPRVAIVGATAPVRLRHRDLSPISRGRGQRRERPRARHRRRRAPGCARRRRRPPIAIVGSGLDVVYPRRHAALWQAVRPGVWC
jgi:hypothetical protein